MTLKILPFILLTALVCFPDYIFADVPEYTVYRAADKITLDGILDEADWSKAQPVGDFSFPWWSGGEKEQTEVKLLWNDDFLYLAFRCDDKHIWADHFNVNSSTYEDDCVELFWNPAPDDQSDYYMFEINCIGVPKSLRRSDRITVMLPYITQTIQGTLNNDSDTDSGWVIEMAVRFDEYNEVSQGKTPVAGDIWRIGLNRCGGKTDAQYSQWSPSQTDSPNFHQPNDFGKIIFSGKTVKTILNGK
ncbi:MAG: carbohydrate-binding family 9-like protein [Candidatus Latescibacteria bacterium]|nr:carbohydrate-binding family 9-like protein [Candidatus Latescibacterota bacterium]